MTAIAQKFRERMAARFFHSEEAEAVEESRHILEWMAAPYHEKFCEWLQAEGSKDINIESSHMDLIKAAVRANVYREILRHLRKIEQAAQHVTQQAQEE